MKVSVIIPNYNHALFLPEAIESALAQSRSVDEIVVVDDGSSDSSLDVARSFPVHVIDRPHRGAQETMHAGVEASSGDAFILLNADDVLARNYVERTARILERDHTIGFVYTAATLFGTIHDFLPARRFSRARLLGSNYVHGSSLIRREAYESTRGFDAVPLAVYEDWYLILDLVERGWHAARTNSTTLYYRQHGPSRNTTGGSAHEQAIYTIMRDHPSLYAPSPEVWYWLHRKLFRHHPQTFVALSLLACLGRRCNDC